MKERKKNSKFNVQKTHRAGSLDEIDEIGDRDFDVLWGLHEAEDAGLLLKIETGR